MHSQCVVDGLPKVTGRCSPVHGKGLFAVNSIAAGDRILKILGDVVATNSLSDEFIAAGHWQGIRVGYCLIRSISPTDFSYVNHSKSSNSYVDLDGLWLVASKEIPKDMEIFLDYDLEPMDERCRRLLGSLKP